MHHKFSTFLAVFFVTVLISARADDQPDLAARQAWLDGFLKMSQADKLAEQGKTVTAIRAYRDAIGIFDGVREKYPKWNAMMVSFRISSCRLHIQELEKAMNPDILKLPEEDLRKRLQSEIAKNSAISEELEQLRQTLQNAPDAQAVHDKDTTIANLKQKLAELEVKLKLEQIKSSRLKSEGDNEKLRQELADLAIRAEDTAQTIKKLEKELEQEKEQNKALRNQLANADKWTTVGQASDAVTTENEQLKKLVFDLKKDLAILQENHDVKLNERQDIDKLEKMALEHENKEGAADAARYWHTLSQKFPEAQEPALRAAYWYWLVEDHDASNLLLDRYFTATARNADPLILLGKVSLDENNWQRALALTSWAAAAAPNNPDAQFALGAVFLANAQTDLAKGCFRKAIAANAKHADSLMALAIVCATVSPRDLAEAKALYERAVEAGYPRDPAFEAVVK